MVVGTLCPLGYKQTDIGVIPEDWEVKPLGQIGESLIGLTYRPSDVHSHGTLVLRSSNVQENDLCFDDNVFVESEIPQRIMVQPNDILICVRNGSRDLIGKSALIDKRAAGMTFGAFMAVFRSRNGRFIYQLFQSNIIKKQINEHLGATINQITNKSLNSFKVPLPTSDDEQNAIAETLSDVNALLGALERLIAKKRALKQAAMQQLLTGQTRLPGFAPAKVHFVKTQVGTIPEDWKLEQLANLIDPTRSIRYGIVQPGNYDPQGRYMIRGQDYSEVKGWATPSEVFRVSPGIEARYRNARVKTGDLIMTIVGYCGHVETVPDWLDGANLTQTTVRIAIQPDIAVSAYVKYLLLSLVGRNQVAAYMKGAAQPGLNCGDIERFLVILPSLPEQTAIAAVLTDMDAEIAALEQRREKTRALKQGMMQELLTGRTRLV